MHDSRIFQCDAAEREDRNLFPASFAQGLETCRASVRHGFLFEDRPEDGEIGALRRRVGNFAWSVTGDANGHAGRSLS